MASIRPTPARRRRVIRARCPKSKIRTGTNNFYVQDGYGGSGANDGSPANAPPKANYGGGSYVDCADPTQPGVAAVWEFLDARKIPAHCEAGHYYLVNNYNPGYFGDGSDAYADQNPNNTVFTVPPSTLRTIGDELSSKNVSWAYFGDQFDLYLADKYGKNPADQYSTYATGHSTRRRS